MSRYPIIITQLRLVRSSLDNRLTVCNYRNFESAGVGRRPRRHHSGFMAWLFFVHQDMAETKDKTLLLLRPVVGVGKGDRGRHTGVGRRWSVRGTPWLGSRRVPTFSNRLEALEIRFGRLMIGGSGRSSAKRPRARETKLRFPSFRLEERRTRKGDPVSASGPQKRLEVPLIYERIATRRYPLNFFPLHHRIVNIITVCRGDNLDRLTTVMLEMVEMKETDWPPRRFTEEPLNRDNAFIIAALSFILYAKKITTKHISRSLIDQMIGISILMRGQFHELLDSFYHSSGCRFPSPLPPSWNVLSCPVKSLISGVDGDRGGGTANRGLKHPIEDLQTRCHPLSPASSLRNLLFPSNLPNPVTTILYVLVLLLPRPPPTSTEDRQPRMFQEYLQNGMGETMVLATRKA
ncbi:hypothetical protein ALC60_02865 [Trachymyrmex zeteki]|uniref:Uncharacterized protein n=1 Tax=Mycetomoellerius zeteki TaxID=64791 RepID=A0A151XCP8_9HYME|nr:hypothetical protein ALC60_02865 [Trachymyrmex zeteki]